MVKAHIHLLLDANANEAELMAECPSCGAAAIESLDSAWQKKFIGWECGITKEIAAENLRHLRAMAAQYQQRIDTLIGAN